MKYITLIGAITACTVVCSENSIFMLMGVPTNHERLFKTSQTLRRHTQPQQSRGV